MKKNSLICLIVAVVMLSIIEAFAQGPNTHIDPLIQIQQQSFFVGSENNKGKPCKDCDEVKHAVKASYVSSRRSFHKKPLSLKRWSRTFSGKVNMKMKKMFAKRYKAKTFYEICYNWH